MRNHRVPFLLVIVFFGLLNARLQAQTNLSYPAITADNAAHVTQLAMLGGGSITTSQWSPDGQVLAVGTALDIRLYYAGEPEPLVVPSTDSTSHLAFSPDSSLLASAHRGLVYLWEVRTGRRIATWDRITQAALS